VVLATVLCARVLRLPLPETSLVATGVAILMYNAAFVLLSRRAYSPQPDIYLRRIRSLVILQVGLDWVSMAVFLHLTGGVTSPGIPLFLIHMLMVTILLPGRSSYVYVALGIGAVATLAGLEATGFLIHYAVIPALPADLYRDPIYAVAAVVFFGIAAVATVTLAASIVTRLHERERQINALLQTTRAVSSTLSLPDVLQALASGAAIALSSARASIRLLDETGERLTLVAAYGLSAAYKEKGPVEVSLDQLKAIFFVKDFGGTSTHVERKVFGTRKKPGKKVFIKFSDKESLVGFIDGQVPWDKGFSLAKLGNKVKGFFLIPVDGDSNNYKVFIVGGAIQDITIMV